MVRESTALRRTGLSRSLIGAALVVSLVISSATTLSAAALAQEFCNKPVRPYCIDQYRDFESTERLDRCDESLEEFIGELDDYEACVTKRIGELREEATNAQKNLEEVRESFEIE